jgi:hypothetical protein
MALSKGGFNRSDNQAKQFKNNPTFTTIFYVRSTVVYSNADVRVKLRTSVR